MCVDCPLERRRLQTAARRAETDSRADPEREGVEAQCSVHTCRYLGVIIIWSLCDIQLTCKTFCTHAIDKPNQFTLSKKKIALHYCFFCLFFLILIQSLLYICGIIVLFATKRLFYSTENIKNKHELDRIRTMQRPKRSE